MSVAPFDLEQARTQVEQRVASIKILGEVDIVHVSDLDAAGLYAFSVTPQAIGRAGEVIYLVGPTELLTAGTPADFDKLMSRLGVGTTANVLALPAFVNLFLRFRVLRHGVLLERADGHPLLRAGQLPAEQFIAPTFDFGADGARYRFWVFDSDRFVPVFWDVRIAPDGSTTFTTRELV